VGHRNSSKGLNLGQGQALARCTKGWVRRTDTGEGMIRAREGSALDFAAVGSGKNMPAWATANGRRVERGEELRRYSYS